MGADWYTCLTFYGYEIKVPNGITYGNFVNELISINEFIQEPYKITGLLQEFHSRMEYASDQELRELDDGATILIGFQPRSNLDDLIHSINELKEYITDNHYLMGLELSENPKFYSGIEWFNRYYEYVSDKDEDSDEDSDEEDEEEEEEEDNEDEDQSDNENGTSSDEDEHKIAPEPTKHKSN
jgi:hypothetical protein